MLISKGMHTIALGKACMDTMHVSEELSTEMQCGLYLHVVNVRVAFVRDDSGKLLG